MPNNQPSSISHSPNMSAKKSFWKIYFCTPDRRLTLTIVFFALAIYIFSNIEKRSAEKMAENERIEMKEWYRFLTENRCKLNAKRDLGVQGKLEYSYLCEDGVTYSKMLAR